MIFENNLKVSLEDRLWSSLCFVPFLGIFTSLVTAVKRVDSDYCSINSRQGFILAVLSFFSILLLFFGSFGVFIFVLLVIVHFVVLGRIFFGKGVKIPVIYPFAERINKYYIYTMLVGQPPEQAILQKGLEDKPKSGNLDSDNLK